MLRKQDTRQRFARRRWHGRLLGIRTAVISLVLAVVLAFGAWVVLFSSWLAVDAVVVSGEQTLSKQAVVSAAAVPMGTPLARVNLDDISTRVARLPAVASVSVHRSWPNTIDIHITERRPVANIHRQGAWWELDRTGVIFRKIPARANGLPVIELHSQVDPETLAATAAVVTALPANLLNQVRRIKAHSMDSIRLQLNDGRVVVWGSSAESPMKVRVLAALLQRKAHLYDVSVPTNPTTAAH
ncbi:MAG: cell division protein FtsQ/DivIB [Nocardioidaceae bacterium]